MDFEELGLSSKEIEEMRRAFRRCDLWLQELTIKGVSLRTMPKTHKDYVHQIFGWSGALVKEEARLRVN